VETHLELDEQFGKDVGDLVHEFVHELRHLRIGNASPTKTEVHRVVQEFFSVHADVEADGDRRRWADAIPR
jgi:hypothetical protein